MVSKIANHARFFLDTPDSSVVSSGLRDVNPFEKDRGRTKYVYLSELSKSLLTSNDCHDPVESNDNDMDLELRARH